LTDSGTALIIVRPGSGIWMGTDGDLRQKYERLDNPEEAEEAWRRDHEYYNCWHGSVCARNGGKCEVSAKRFVKCNALRGDVLTTKLNVDRTIAELRSPGAAFEQRSLSSRIVRRCTVEGGDESFLAVIVSSGYSADSVDSLLYQAY